MSNPRSPLKGNNASLSPTNEPQAQTQAQSQETSNATDNENLDAIRAEYSQLGVSPRLPNIPLRSANNSGAAGLASPTSNFSPNLPDPDSESLTLGVSLDPPANQRANDAENPQSQGNANTNRNSSSNSNTSSNRVSMTDSELGVGLQDGNMDLDTLPISDEQKARIIARHLNPPNQSGISLQDSPSLGASRPNSLAPGRTATFENQPSSSSSQHADSDMEELIDSQSQTEDHQDEEEETEPSYSGPHQMQGGAITDDVYRWAHYNKRKSVKRSRSESLHLPSTSHIDPSLDGRAIREPGGFRRYFVINQAAEEGRPKPRALRSFIDFLSLYGHFAGEYLEEEDDESDDEEDEESVIGNHAGAAREGRGNSEQSSLLRKRPGGRLGTRMDSQTASRIRRASADRRRGEASVTEAVMMLLKSFVGTGILFLGKAFFNGGLLFSSIVLCLVAMISLISFLLLVKTNLKVSGSFGEMGGILYGNEMRLSILTSIVFSQLGFVAAYTVFVAQNLQSFILGVSKCEHLIPLSYLILLQALIFLPLSLIRRIAKLSSTALIADGFILFGIIYLFQFEIRQVFEHGLSDVKMFNSHSFPLFIGTAVFTFEGIGLVIPITESMAQPERFPRVLSGVMIGVMILFATSGALSYSAFGSKVQTVVINNLPQSSKFVQAMQFLYSLAILLSTPLQLFPALSILERGVFTTKSGKYDWKIKTYKNLFRCSIVLLASLFAYLGSSSLDVFVSFIGSIACVPLCFIYPPLLHLKACATKTRTRVLDYSLLVFGIVCILFAGSQTVRELANPGKGPDAPVCVPPVL